MSDTLLAWSAINTVIDHMNEYATDCGDDHAAGLCNCKLRADIETLERARDLISPHSSQETRSAPQSPFAGASMRVQQWPAVTPKRADADRWDDSQDLTDRDR